MRKTTLISIGISAVVGISTARVLYNSNTESAEMWLYACALLPMTIACLPMAIGQLGKVEEKFHSLFNRTEGALLIGTLVAVGPIAVTAFYAGNLVLRLPPLEITVGILIPLAITTTLPIAVGALWIGISLPWERTVRGVITLLLIGSCMRLIFMIPQI